MAGILAAVLEIGYRIAPNVTDWNWPGIYQEPNREARICRRTGLRWNGGLVLDQCFHSLTVSQLSIHVLSSAARALPEAEYQMKAELVTNRGDRI